jgi:hypothetical protein
VPRSLPVLRLGRTLRRRRAVIFRKLVAAALHGGGVNGTTNGRMAFGPASVGGPAGDRSGIIGTSVRTKH